MQSLSALALDSSRPRSLPRDPELAQRREGDALVEHAIIVALDFVKQCSVNGGHDETGALRRAVFRRQHAKRVRKYLEDAYRAGGRGAQLPNQLLDLSRTSALINDPVDVN
jgi:hypothetical protein